jgi:hypothetical protein
MGRSRVFFPQLALDQWVSEGRVDLFGDQLELKVQGRRYRIVEAVRVLRLVSEGTDIHEVTGRVKSVAYLRELGAELLGDSMIIGDLAYEVVLGFWGTPMGSSLERRASAGGSGGTLRPPDSLSPKSDQELLAEFLIQSLQ